MDVMFDPLLNPYHVAEETETSAYTPQELQTLKERQHETANNIRRNVPF